MNQRELERWGKYWQDILGLNDWDIKYRFVHSHEFVNEMSDGEAQVADSTIVYQNRQASIRLLHPDCFPDETTAVFGQDLHHDLIHELIHCFFDPFYEPEKGLKQQMQEQAIDSMATAVLRAHDGF